MKLVKKNKAWQSILCGISKEQIDKARGKSEISVKVEKAATKIEPIQDNK